MNYNKVLLAGRLTKNVEIRSTPSGTAVADIPIAINETYKNAQGETVEKTTFVDVTCWGKQAESCAEFLSKGSPVFVDGKLELDQWTGQDGEKRNKLRVRADRVQFLGGKRDGSPSDKPAESKTASAVDDGEVPF